MRQIECAGGIVTNRDRHVLVITNQMGRHTLPKGTRKEGEIPIDTAIREIREESGLVRVEIVAYLGVLIRSGFTAENAESPSVKKYIDMFYCTTDEMELRPAAEDAVAAQWVTQR